MYGLVCARGRNGLRVPYRIRRFTCFLWISAQAWPGSGISSSLKDREIVIKGGHIQMNVYCKPRFFSLLSACWVFAALFVAAAPASAVVVAGGDNGWEVSFDGNVNGFLVYEDSDSTPRGATIVSATSIPALEAALRTGDRPPVADRCATSITNGCINLVLNSSLQGGTLAGDTRVARVRTGLLPAFFSFNVRSPEVSGLRGSARISFAPQIQNANTKNQFGAQVDLREVFFNVDGAFGTISVGRTLSLFQRQNILNDMTLFGVGVNGGNGAGGGGTTLGRIGYGYVYPQFNSRITYKTPNVNGFQLEAGIYDPSKICGPGGCAGQTKTPRLESEISYASSYDFGAFKGWFGAMWQDAENYGGDASSEVTAWGISGGAQISYGGFAVTAAGYTGEALGSVLMLDTDALDALGNERDNHGFYVQGTYSIGALKLGASYGENNAEEDGRPYTLTGTGVDTMVDSTTTYTTITQNAVYPISKLSALTFGAYYDVTSWFKLIAEYTRVTNEWTVQDGRIVSGDLEQDSNVFSVGSFFFW